MRRNSVIMKLLNPNITTKEFLLMHSIITEELRFRKRVCEYAIKYGNNAEAARRYHT